MHRDDRGFYQKFKRQNLISRMDSGKIVVGVSGGADSVALLHLLWRLSSEKKWALVPAHIQHNLRGQESLRDQKFVQMLCKKLGTPCVVRSIKISNSTRKLGMEETARTFRYAALARIAHNLKSHTIVTAHNANDQAETFFLHLIRGSGTDGLCGMFPMRSLSEITGKEKHSNLQLIRPLLQFSRREILFYLQSQKLSYCRDSSNSDLKLRRNWIRHKLIPLLETIQPRMAQRIADLSAIFQNEKKWKEPFLQEKMRGLMRFRSGKRLALDLIRFFHYNRELQLQFLHRFFSQNSFREIEEIYARLERKNKERIKKGGSRWVLPL